MPDPRTAALNLYEQVILHGKSPETLLGQARDMDERDRAFLRHLVMTALRHWGITQAMLQTLIAKPLPQTEKRVELALALGITQLLYMDTPPHAAVHTTVELVKKRHARYGGLANAVLQKVARGEVAIPGDEHRLPVWLRERLTASYGEEAMRAIAHVAGVIPPLDLTFTDITARTRFSDAYPEATLLPTGSLRLAYTGSVEKLPFFSEGIWWVQDAAAALPVRLLGDIAGRRVLDLCAAPGGKTMQLATAGASVTAVEKTASRLRILRENLTRTNLSVDMVEADALHYTGGPFDAILLDAPCSATGTLRRHPDVMWHRSKVDITRLASIQKHMLEHAATLLAPGGTLVYAVCSLEPEEGEQQIARFLADHPRFSRIPVRAEELGGENAFLSPQQGDLRTLPCHWREQGGLDGFYATRLRKNS